MYLINNNIYTKEELKIMLQITIKNRIDYAIEFAFLILEQIKMPEKLIVYDIITALSIKDISCAKEKIKSW